MSNGRLKSHSIFGAAGDEIKQQTLSLLVHSQHYPTAIALYCRLRSRHTSEHSYLITTTAGASGAEPWLVAYVDRTRRPEAEVWLYGNWEVHGESIQAESVIRLLKELFQLIGGLTLPDSIHARTGSALEAETSLINNKIILCGAVHEVTFRYMRDSGLIFTPPGIAEIGYHTFTFDIDRLPPDNELPNGLYWGTARPDDYALIRSTSVIPRQDRTLAILRSRAIFEQQTEKLAAWGFKGIDGSLSTLYVMPEHRGLGLGKAVLLKLLKNDVDEYSNTEDARLGYCHVAPNNYASIRMVESVGGLPLTHAVYWVRVDLSKASDSVQHNVGESVSNVSLKQ